MSDTLIYWLVFCLTIPAGLVIYHVARHWGERQRQLETDYEEVVRLINE